MGPTEGQGGQTVHEGSRSSSYGMSDDVLHWKEVGEDEVKQKGPLFAGQHDRPASNELS